MPGPGVTYLVVVFSPLAAAFWRKKPPPPPPPAAVTPELLALLACAALGLVVLAVAWRMASSSWSNSAASSDDSPGPGRTACSLVFSNSSTGSLHVCWHTTKVPVEDALAIFVPTVPVPAHKLSHNAGRQEIARNIGGPNPKGYYSGWCQFISLAHKFGCSEVHVKRNVPNRAIQVSSVSGASSKITTVREGGTVQLAGAVAVAVLSSLDASFDVTFMPVLTFKQLGNKLGATVIFDKSHEESTDTLKLTSVLARRSTLSGDGEELAASAASAAAAATAPAPAAAPAAAGWMWSAPATA